MSIDVLENTTRTVTVVPGYLWASASAVVLSPSGATLASPVATVDSFSADVEDSANNTRSALVLSSVAGLQVGHEYLVTDTAGWDAVARVAKVDASARLVTFDDALPEVPAAGATVQGIEVTATIPAITDRDRNYRIIFTDGLGAQVPVAFHVVRNVFSDPIDAAGVRRFVAEQWPNERRSSTWFRGVADEANRRVRNRLLQHAEYPHWFGDPDAFREAGLAAARMVLMDRNLIPSGRNPDEYSRAVEFGLRDRVAEAIRSLTVKDERETGDVSDDEAERGALWTVELRR